MTYLWFSTADSHTTNDGTSKEQDDGDGAGDNNSYDTGLNSLDVAALVHY